MSSMLVNLSIQHRQTAQHVVDGKVAEVRVLVPSLLRMVLTVTPNEERVAQALGFLTVTVESNQPPHLEQIPEMTPTETKAWLIEMLKQSL